MKRLLVGLVVLAMAATACGGDDEGSSLLDEVIDRDSVICGVNETLPGFGVVDENGNLSGFDIEFCRVVAAGVLGDADKVEYVPLNADARFTALQSGEIDLLIRNTTWTATRDGQEGANFLFTTYYDGQGMMVQPPPGSPRSRTWQMPTSACSPARPPS